MNRSGGRSEWLPLLIIAAPFVVGWAAVSPWQNVPVIDDWVYAWSVEHLLKTHTLAIADISAVYPIAQIIWGSLFAAVAGFSFGALRLSTVVLAVFGCWAIYLTLRELKIGVTASLLGALNMAWHPVYFALAFSFMTDVPFVSLACITLFWYVSGVERRRPVRLWIGALFAVLAFLVRSVGIALPLCVLAVSLRQIRLKPDPTTDKARARSSKLWDPALAGLFSAATALAVMIVLWLALPTIVGPLSGQDIRLEKLQWIFLVTWREYADWNLNMLFIAALPFGPILLATLAERRMRLRIAVVAALLAALCALTIRAIPTPLPDWQTWSLQDLATRAMIGGTLAPSTWSVRVTPVVKVAGIFVAAALLVTLATVARSVNRGGRVLMAFGAVNLVLINVLWFYNDRYYLMLIPFIVYAAAAGLSASSGRWIAGGLLAVWAFVSTTGVRDMLATNAVVARIAGELEAQGVSPSEIDAGYSLNGWRLYVHPENLPPGGDRSTDVPFVTSNRDVMYRIVNIPQEGYDVVRVEQLPGAWWQVTDRVYVIRRR